MKVAAFNVKQLGINRINDEKVLNTLIEIVSRYSVMVLLEVLDSSGKAMDRFLTKLNQHRQNRRNPFTMESSIPLGRSNYKEKFVFFYRESEVDLVDTFQYKERRDVLAREPFVVKFRCLNTALRDLILIPVHSTPVDAALELDALANVVEAVRGKWRSNSIMILGDFNADGRYLSERTNESPMRCRPYYWLIDDDVDTTTSDSNDYTYDRIVVYGRRMNNAVVPNSARVFNFSRAYHLSAQDAERISDHYPVEVELQ
ncbi:deoxyribonuclease-1-like isoform X1 [Echeneis naucrates]|uniref:deoxyribonuclease-1-like isoform X1 n=1 Tax=Echeneis naucrates TaxID=173247 RepID=UPI0011142664|nr:deoxyribonuclease-1-like isoform X1 [Echeneis naucrates]